MIQSLDRSTDDAGNEILEFCCRWVLLIVVQASADRL
jgi:hypothetical protein